MKNINMRVGPRDGKTERKSGGFLIANHPPPRGRYGGTSANYANKSQEIPFRVVGVFRGHNFRLLFSQVGSPQPWSQESSKLQAPGSPDQPAVSLHFALLRFTSLGEGYPPSPQPRKDIEP